MTSDEEIENRSKAILFRDGKTFWFVSRFLSKKFSRDAARLYAFCRMLDDWVDGGDHAGPKKLDDLVEFFYSSSRIENNFKDRISSIKTFSEEEKKTLQNTIMAGVPGTRDVLSIEEFRSRHAEYDSIDELQLLKNLINFLKVIIPEAESIDLKMCIHPDDPPYSIFGLPRTVKNISSISKILESVPSYYNGLTFCSGSLGANPKNNLAEIFKTFSEKVHFIHLRSIELEKDNSFFETGHLKGNINLAQIMEIIIHEQLRRSMSDKKDISIPIRSDHGSLMLGDINLGKRFYPGYSTIGRMKGLAELSGLELGLRHKILDH